MLNRLVTGARRPSIILAIIASILSIHLMQCHLQEDGLRDYYPSSDALATIPEAAPPLDSSEQAAGYAVHQLGILPQLEESEKRPFINGWSLQVERESGETELLWKVRIKSKTDQFAPPFVCVRTFDRAGQVMSPSSPGNFCSFNK